MSLINPPVGSFHAKLRLDSNFTDEVREDHVVRALKFASCGTPRAAADVALDAMHLASDGFMRARLFAAASRLYAQAEEWA